MRTPINFEEKSRLLKLGIFRYPEIVTDYLPQQQSQPTMFATKTGGSAAAGKSSRPERRAILMFTGTGISTLESDSSLLPGGTLAREVRLGFQETPA